MSIRDEYVENFNMVSSTTKGGVSRQSIMLVAVVFTVFDWFVKKVQSSGPKTGQPNPFNLRALPREDGTNFDVG